ncbi:CHAT domain-containing protein [Aulosira sp. FACHB-615]|uniref:CHAT domain-containing protein n=1 Tax=Aulosira sp. FACHB-615 TaxID=2692777 RepID=UPI0028C3C855|nr:CHAT domain-containing protein [Aulosira sp. FACHB-615]
MPLTNRRFEFGTVVSAQSGNPGQLVQQGLEFYQVGDITAAIANWNQALSIYHQNHNAVTEVIVRENLARAYQEIGQGEQALIHWEQVTVYHHKVGNLQQVGRSFTEQAQVYSSLGQPTKAIALLCNPDKYNHCSSDSALQIAQTQKDLIGEAAALGSLGDATRLTGYYELAIKHLEKSLAIAKKLNISPLRVSIFNSLGNAHSSLAQVKYRRAESATQRGNEQEAKKLLDNAKQEDANALRYLGNSLEIASSQKDVAGQVRSLLSIIPIYYRNNATAEANNSLEQGINLIKSLPDSRRRVYATIDFVRLLQLVEDNAISWRINCIQPEAYTQATSLLDQAITTARNIGDFRAESFALGELGHIYECRQEYSKALSITNRARLASEQGLKAQDSLYLWEWQTGRILKAQGKFDSAISAYEQAIKTLDTIRRDILTANRDIQFDFRDTIEPIYRDLVELRLRKEQPIQTATKSLVYSDNTQPQLFTFKEKEESKENLSSVIKTINSLKLAELQNYFGNDCIIAPFPTRNIEEVGNSTTAFINTIILTDKTAVILTLPSGQKKLSTIAFKRQDFIHKVNRFRRTLESFRDIEYDTKPAQEIYDWLIRPFEKDFEVEKIKTLVFIQDGILRTVPMASLHDGKQFLIQKYAIASIPSLDLTDIKPLNRQNLRILALGLTHKADVDGQVWDALPNVTTEIDGVVSKIPGKKLLDDDFTSDRLKAEIDKQVYSIIHIATHGDFGYEPEDTFIITGKNAATGKNEKLSFTELDKYIRSVTRSNKLLELLALTACKTSVGDERSALGLAGVAIQAGAKSALASLWAIQDNSTSQIAISFYSKLLNNPSISKAEALQSAQKEMIEGKTAQGELWSHPAYWSPLILIGNWL